MKAFKVGIIGTGWIAERMAETLSDMEGVEKYAVASRTKDKADAFAKQWGFCRSYGSYEDLANDSDTDLVYIATPHSHHYDNVKMCLLAGRNVLCEKAFTANARQAEELIDLAHNRGIFLTEAIWTRYQPLRKTICELIDSGIVGKVHQLSANLCDPNIDKPRMYLPELAGGVLLDLGVYTLNFAAMFFGPDYKIVSSSCQLTDTGVDAANTMTLHWPDGRMGVLWSSNLVRSDRQGVISGDKGHIIIENINNPQSATVVDNDYNSIKVVKCPHQITGYEYQVYESMNCIRKGETESPFMPHEETIRIMKEMDSLRKAWGVKYPWD
ncbi:MAG: Gfo/Idh/MocA family oxidoreductase [Bacteroidaceae bacterium]|nr:Gfo/Idh/MocA family oxidoreductase [Bacteroidaceae bacterium]